MKAYIHLAFILVFSSCANMVTPTGGDKDEKAPVLMKSNLTSTNFKDNKIILTFDETVETESPLTNITLQPRHSTLNTTNNKNRIIIALDSVLKPNTTYSLRIDGGIKDIHEGNKYSFDYVFSTGDQIDTNFISYSIPETQNKTNLKIGITDKKYDSLKGLKFDYLYSFNKNTINVLGLGKEDYYTWIFTDADNDNIPDLYSPVYYDTAVKNLNKTIELYNWNSIENNHVKKYAHHIKIFKPIADISTYNQSNTIYIDKDSALFYNTTKDTFPELDLRKELIQKYSIGMKVISDTKECITIIDKYNADRIKVKDNVTVKDENGYLYIYSKNVTDSVNLILYYGSDSISFYALNKNVKTLTSLGLLKLKGTDNMNNIICIKRGDKTEIIKQADLKKGMILYLDPGEYEVLIYRTSFFKKISFNLENLSAPNAFKIRKKIELRANWEEVLDVVFE